MRKAYEIANEENIEGGTITEDVLKEAVMRLRPSTQQVEFMTMLAIKECDDKDLLPERYKDLLDDKK